MKEVKERHSSTLSAIIKGTFVAFLLTIVVFIICAVVMTTGTNGISDSTLGIVIYITSAVSVMAGAMKTASSITKGGLPNGLIVAVIYVIAIILTGFFVTPEYSVGIKTLVTLALCLAGGGLGGIIGINIH